MELYFVRHGQSENNLLYATSGNNEGRSEDPELTEAGREQAERVAAFLARGGDEGSGEHPGYGVEDEGWVANPLGITHLYASPMIRCLSTGQAIARRLGLPLVVWPDLHEIGGVFLRDPESGENVGLPGKDRAYLGQRYPELVLTEEMGEGGWWDRPFEERPLRLPRAQRVLQELRERHTPGDDRVVWVSHGGFHSYLMAAILGLNERDGLWFSLNNVAITQIGFSELGTVVRHLNRVSFLPRSLIT